MDIKSIFSNNLVKLMKIHNEGVKDLAIGLDVAESTVSDWKLGKKMPRSGGLQKIADHYNVNVTDLLSDIPNTINYSLSNKVINGNHILPKNQNPQLYQVSIPVLGKIACGEPILADQNIEEYRQLLFDHKPYGVLFSLKCKGDSMEPIIPNGSFVTVRQQDTVEDGELAAVLIDDEATIKRVKYAGKVILLIPENKKYKPIVLNEDNPGRILGKVIHVDYDVL